MNAFQKRSRLHPFRRPWACEPQTAVAFLMPHGAEFALPECAELPWAEGEEAATAAALRACGPGLEVHEHGPTIYFRLNGSLREVLFCVCVLFCGRRLMWRVFAALTFCPHFS